jgi:hypothetical protein
MKCNETLSKWCKNKHIASKIIDTFETYQCLTDFMNYLIHATPVHPSLCLQYLILLFTIATIIAFILLLLLLFHYYHHYKTVTTDKPLWASLFPGAAELTTHLLRLINILWLPLCRINKFGFYFPQRLLRSSILVGHHVPPPAPPGPLYRWPCPRVLVGYDTNCIYVGNMEAGT